MQQTLSYSSSPSPTLISTIPTHPIRSPGRPRSTDTASATPAIISVDYSYDPNSIMSPSTHSKADQHSPEGVRSEVLYLEKTSASNQPYSSLFGDPVPPPQPEDYFGTAAFETIRAASVDMPSSEEDTLLAAVALNTLITNDGRRRLFSNVPYTSMSSNSLAQHQSLLPIPRLQPPDIQILPNSSGGSSSEQLDSPNFLLLAPQDIVNKPDVYEVEYEQPEQPVGSTYVPSASEQDDVNKHRPISGSYDSTGLDWYRPAAQHYAEFSRIPKLRPSSKMIMSMKHEEMPLSPLATMLHDSNGSSSGGEDPLPTMAEQQLQIRSPVPNTIPTPTMDMDIILSPKQYLQQQQRDIMRRESYSTAYGPETPRTPSVSLSRMPVYDAETPRTPSVSHSRIPTPGNETSPEQDEELEREELRSQTLAGEMSPVVLKDSVSTGGDYRVGETRLHKKSSFTIISVRSPKSSLSRSPSATPVAQRRKSSTRIPDVPRHASIQSTTTSSIVAPPPPVRTRRKSITGSRIPQLPLPNTLPPHSSGMMANDDSPRPSVQFNMSGRYSPSKLAMPPKGILQQRDSLTSSVDTYTPRALRRGSVNMPATSDISGPFGQRIKSMETLPLITDPYRSAIPRFHRSDMHLDKEPAIIPPGALPRPLKPNPNPTRKQRGLLGVINKEQVVPRQPPRSNWISLDDLVLGTRPAKSSLEPIRIQTRRRSSSTSPERRSSTQTASDRRSSNLSSITSDFSFRRPSLSTLPATTQRRKSIYLPTGDTKMSPSPRRKPFSSTDLKHMNKRAKIAKPSTLSPIIGTPNKDTPQSPLHGAVYEAAHRDTASEMSVRRDSISRIPVRSRRGSMSQPSSRSNSPLKDFNLLSGRTSQASNSRSPSQATIRSNVDVYGLGVTDIRLTPTRFSSSRPVSRGPPSRPTSRLELSHDVGVTLRANSRANSRTDSRAGSKSNSRANSRVNSQANSRANSRLSVRSSLRSSSISPAAMFRNGRRSDTMPNRRKSVSTSPKQAALRGMLGRKMSLSPAGKTSRQSPKRDRKEETLASQRRNSRSRIPTSISRNMEKSGSPSKNKDKPKPAEKSRSPKGKKVTATPRKSSPKQKSTKSESAKKKPSSSNKTEPAPKRTASKTSTTITAKKTPTAQPKTPQAQKQKPVTKQGPAINQNKDKSVNKVNGSNGVSGLPKPLTRTGSQQNTKKVNAENATQKVQPKATPQKIEAEQNIVVDDINPLAVQVGNAVLQAAEALPAVRNEVSATAAGGMKRQGSNMSTLVRMSSRLSLVSNKKRVDSAQNHRVSTVTEQKHETDAPGQLTSSDGQTATSTDTTLKTLESETTKTINEHLTDSKTHDNETGVTPTTVSSPSPAGAAGVPKASHDTTTRLDTADGSNAQRSSAEIQKSPLPPTQPIEAAISVLNAHDIDSASAHVSGHAKQPLDHDSANSKEEHAANFDHATAAVVDDFEVDNKRLSPDGQGGSTAGSGGNANRTSSQQEFLKDDVSSKRGICRCCTNLCMRFRRSQCMRCCGRRQDRLHASADEQPVLSSARSSATTQLEVIDETKANSKKKSRCWPTSNCCRKKPKEASEASAKETKASTMTAEPKHLSSSMQRPKQQGKCGLCLRKIFCCRSVNKVDPVTGDETELRKCCFCIPCRRKRATESSSEPKVAWRDRDPELGISPTDAAIVEGSSVAPSTTAPTEDLSKMGCCKRFWLCLFCCRKKPRRVPEARRQSIKAPPASEETRRKLHNDLVEYTSKMKGAIPVLPLYLAWFCAICNVIFPGLGTLLSGLFCLCVGIPRFSQFDSARARIGSFIINIIVAVAQFFCVLFCCVGWGWSIWWGTIMLRCAKKLSKIKKVERLELEEEQRQAEMAAATAAAIHRGETEATKT